MNSIQELLAELRRHGLTDAEIGVLIDAPQSVVNRLRRGTHSTTNYARGLRIAKLAAKLRARHSRATSTGGDS